MPCRGSWLITKVSGACVKYASLNIILTFYEYSASKGMSDR